MLGCPQKYGLCKMQKRRYYQLAILTLATLSTACGSGAKPKAQDFKVPVKVAAVETGTIEDSSEYVATLQSRQSVTLLPRVDGQISQIFVKSGDRIEAGSPIMQIDPAKQQASVSGLDSAVLSARADLENAKATLSSLEAQKISRQADLNLNQQDFRRYSELTAQGATTKQRLDLASNQLKVSRANLEAIDAQIRAQRSTIVKNQSLVEQSRSNVAEQEVQLQFYRINAPFAGRVGDIPIKIGDYVKDTTALTTITQNQPLELQVAIPLEKIPQLRMGMTVELLDTANNVIGNSKVFFIAPNINNQSQSVLVKTLYQNTDGKLRADQFVKAKVVWDSKPGVLVPTIAITRLGGQNFIFVAENKDNTLVAKQKPVKLGIIQDNKYQVLEGLQQGEKIVVSGIIKLRNDTPIAPET
jgi:multidrug efflux pump subunit AcrA (membrane-fusion protein)